jgi:hypothetical protein
VKFVTKRDDRTFVTVVPGNQAQAAE